LRLADQIQTTMKVARRSVRLCVIDPLLKFDIAIHDNIEVDPT
jgi:hypothetical protein